MRRAVAALSLAAIAGCVDSPAICRQAPSATLDRGTWCEKFATARCERERRCGFSDGGCECLAENHATCSIRVAEGSEAAWEFLPSDAQACLDGLATGSCEAGLAEAEHLARRAFFPSSPGGRISWKFHAWHDWQPPSCGSVFRPVALPGLGERCDPWGAPHHFNLPRTCAEGTCVSSGTSCGTCVAGGLPGESCLSMVWGQQCSRGAFNAQAPDGGCLCVAARADGEACATNGECDSGVCGDLSRRCGRVGLGARCGAEDECGDDAYCQGSTVYSTPLGMAGDAGVCAPRIPPGGACLNEPIDDGCADREQVCVAGRCAPPYSLASDATCSDQDECASGLRCQGTCQPSVWTGDGWVRGQREVSELACGG